MTKEQLRREWGVKNGAITHYPFSKKNAIALLKHTIGGALVSRTKESLTPAGPWERTLKENKNAREKNLM